MEEKTKTIWIGPEFISIGESILKDNKIHYKDLGGIPFLSNYTPVLANTNRLHYQERKLWKTNIGDTGIKIKIYFNDLLLNKFYTHTNPQDQHVIVSLKKENELLKLMIEDLRKQLYDLSGEDRMSKKIKDMADLNNLMRGYGYSGYFPQQYPAISQDEMNKEV
jgi:hypothetical protein